MSGGSHNYIYQRIQEASELYQPKRKEDHFELRGKISDALEIMASITHDIEWIDSADYGEDKWSIVEDNLVKIKEILNDL